MNWLILKEINMNISNEHLIPMPVLDIGDKLKNTRITESEKFQLRGRVFAIKEYCEKVLKNT